MASASNFDPEYEHWGNVIKSEMQGLSMEGHRALKRTSSYVHCMSIIFVYLRIH